jgi:hypothetical protein
MRSRSPRNATKMWACDRVSLFNKVDMDEADSLSHLRCVVVQDGGSVVDERCGYGELAACDEDRGGERDKQVGD